MTKFPFMMYMAVNSSFSRDLDFEYKYWYSLFFHGNKYILKAFFSLGGYRLWLYLFLQQPSVVYVNFSCMGMLEIQLVAAIFRTRKHRFTRIIPRFWMKSMYSGGHFK